MLELYAKIWERETRIHSSAWRIPNFLCEINERPIPVLINQQLNLISHGLVCSYFSEKLFLTFLLRLDFKSLVKSRGEGTFLSLAPSVNI